MDVKETNKNKKLNELIKCGDINLVKNYIIENNMKIDQYFYILSALKNKEMLNYLLLNMDKLNFRVLSKRKIIDKMLDLKYDKELLLFLDKTQYEKYYESIEQLALRIVKTNNDYLIKEFFKRYKKYYFLMESSYIYLMKNNRYELLDIQEKRQYRFLSKYVSKYKELKSFVEMRKKEYLNLNIKKIMELFNEIKNYTVEDFKNNELIFKNEEIRELLIKIYKKKNKEVPKELEEYILSLNLYNF